ncbi:MAG: prepilin-type N-terminal cleavage/methylation domain-containing protein [Proteobacteria bacterium]|nr:prepilin-type N-terminal cleavage/methylation domain-containing protein [Pseudomonadota bacterium]
MKRPLKGFTLVEVIIAMVVIGIGLSGILSVMMASVNNSISPELQWQVNVLGENIVKRIIALENTTNTGCVATQAHAYKVLCDYQGLDHARLLMVFPDLADNVEDAKNIKVSVRISPFDAQGVMLISVQLSHGALGDTYFSALKTKGTCL